MTSDQSHPLGTQSALLQLQAVSFCPSPNSTYRLQNLSFSVSPGDRLALIGPSGSGKSTLLRLLNRLSEPTSGAILLEGQDIRQLPVLELRRQVVLMPQEVKLLGMTAREAIAYPLRLRGLSASAIRQHCGEWTEWLRIPEEWLERTELQLSVGQRQLVAIARTLMSQPKILLLDEPTAALDQQRGLQVLTILAHLAQQRQMTIIMANHQLDFVQQFCDRAIYLHQGKIWWDQQAPQINWPELQDTLTQAESPGEQIWL